MKSSEPAIICFPFLGRFVGGSHISAIGLIRNLDRFHFRPLTVLHSTDGPLADLLRREGVPFCASPCRADFDPENKVETFFRISRALPSLVTFLRQNNVDLVHTNDNRAHFIWGAAARSAGAKHLWHHRSDPEAFGLRWLAPILANQVVSVSEFARPRPGYFSAVSKSSVIRSPFDTSIADRIDRGESRSRLIDEIGCPSDTRLIGYVGNLVDRKRPILFVEAIAELRRVAPDIKVAGLLFGEASHGLDAAARARATELGAGDIVHVMGFRYPGEPLIAALDLLLVTAIDEPFGRTLIEAMLLGTPVVAADSGGNREAIVHRRNGLLVHSDNPTAFATASLELIRDPLLRRSVVAAAALYAHENFGLDKHVNSIARIYEKLLCDGSSQ